MIQKDVDNALDFALEFRKKCLKHAEKLESEKTISAHKAAKMWFNVMDTCDELIEHLSAK